MGVSIGPVFDPISTTEDASVVLNPLLVSVIDSIAISELAQSGSPSVDKITVTEAVWIASGIRFGSLLTAGGMPVSFVGNPVRGYVPTVLDLWSNACAGASSPAIFAPSMLRPGSITAPPHATRVYIFDTPPLRPGVWQFGVEPHDIRPETGNPSPTRTTVNHDLISYWLHADTMTQDVECMTVAYDDVTKTLQVVVQPSPDFLVVGICVSDAVAVAESRTVTKV